MKQLYGIILIICLSACSTTSTKDVNYERTNWLSQGALEDWLSNKDKDEFWKRGFWIVNVEGKVTDSKDTYRITTDKAPTDKYYWWLWWYGQSDTEFENHKTKLKVDDFELVNESSFTSVKGGIKKSGVWHKTRE